MKSMTIRRHNEDEDKDQEGEEKSKKTQLPTQQQ